MGDALKLAWALWRRVVQPALRGEDVLRRRVQDVLPDELRSRVALRRARRLIREGRERDQ